MASLIVVLLYTSIHQSCMRVYTLAGQFCTAQRPALRTAGLIEGHQGRGNYVREPKAGQ